MRARYRYNYALAIDNYRFLYCESMSSPVPSRNTHKLTIRNAISGVRHEIAGLAMGRSERLCLWAIRVGNGYGEAQIQHLRRMKFDYRYIFPGYKDFIVPLGVRSVGRIVRECRRQYGLYLHMGNAPATERQES